MNQFPNDDQELIDFLKQYRSPTPPAEAALEQRLFGAIEAETQPETLIQFRRSQPRSRRSLFWLVPPTLAAGLLATVVGYRTLVPAKPSAAELANLQAFMESNWQGTVSTSSTDDVPLFNDGATN